MSMTFLCIYFAYFDNKVFTPFKLPAICAQLTSSELYTYVVYAAPFKSRFRLSVNKQTSCCRVCSHHMVGHASKPGEEFQNGGRSQRRSWPGGSGGPLRSAGRLV